METSALRVFIDKVKELNDIEEIIKEEGVALGDNLKAICPFHREVDGSFSVKKDEQYAHCFGCHWTGDVIAFIQHKKSLEFMGALSYLARRVKLTVPNLTQEDKTRIEKERYIEEALTKTTQYYQSQLTKPAREYLERRGITDESIERFKIGYASGGLKEHLLDACHLSLDLCIEAGVIKRKADGALKDYFYERIILPTLRNEKTIFLVGRSIAENNNLPKYLNLPLPIKSLYNEQAIYKGEICLVEGIIDCISFEQLGFPTVAIMSNNVQDKLRLTKLARCDKINLCLDADSGGRLFIEAIGKAFPDKVHVVELPEGQDPNDFCLSAKKEDLQKRLNDSQGIIHHLIKKIPSEINKTELPKRLEAVLEMLSHMQQAKTEAYLKDIKSYFNLDARELDGYREQIKESRKKRYKDNKNKQANANKEDSRVVTAIFPGLVDLVEDNGRTAFLVKNKEGLSLVSEYKYEDNVFIPPSKDKIPWLLPRGSKCLEAYEQYRVGSRTETCGKLFDDLKAHHESISTLPSEAHYALLAAWVMHTYSLEDAQYSPVLCLFAIPERGKSRTGKGLIHVAYRGIHVESLREAYLLRVGEHFGGALFFDVKDIWKKAEKHGSEDILLLRFEKGAKVARVLYPDAGPFEDTVYFKVFGPTIIATNEPPDQILETRAVTIVMPEASAKFEGEVTPELALPLKERLVAFRAACMGEKLPDVSKPANGRLGDILKPILQIIHLAKPASIPTFQGLIEELSNDRSNERNSSIEAELLSAILTLEDKVANGKLAVKPITTKINMNKPQRFELTPQYIGRRLGAMGFKKASIGNGCSAILWDEKLMQGLMNKYGVEKHPKPQKDHKHPKITKTP